MPDELTVMAAVASLGTVGYVACPDIAPEPGFEKAVIYARDEVPMHVARQLPGGRNFKLTGARPLLSFVVGEIQRRPDFLAPKPFGRASMNLDDKVCYCFHVSRRKLVNWVRLNEPRVPSQLSLCAGAGTGCGWCIPFLKQIFRQGVEGEAAAPGAEVEAMSAEDYAQRRAEYVKSGRGTPPSGAEPLPMPAEPKMGAHPESE